MSRALWPWMLAYALSGCSVTALAERERTTAVNECTSSSDCGQGFCSEGTCLARPAQVSIERVLFELTPHSTATGFGGKPVYLETAIPLSGEFDLDFGGFAEITVTARVPEACRGASFVSYQEPAGSVPVVGDTLPARFTLTPSVGRLGLAADEYRAEVNTELLEAGNEPLPHAVRFLGPLGAYDVYVEPRPLSASPANDPLRSKCSLPPQLIRQQPLGASALAPLTVKLPSPASLGVQVRLPTAYSLEGWTVAVVEPDGGRLISTTQTIRADAKSPYDLDPPLYYYPVWTYGIPDADTSSTELLRLSPPAGSSAPTFYYQRKTIEIFDRGSAVIEPPPALPAPVSFEGQVLGAGDSRPLSAEVVLTATELATFGSGVSATFEARAQTDRNGRFTAALLPGKYRVRATPDQNSEAYAAADAEWEVADTPRRQTGRTLELPVRLELTGRAVSSWNNSGVFGALVAVEPSKLGDGSSLLTRALGAAPPAPRPALGSISEVSGQFNVDSDFGKVDFSVRPPDASKLPWFVMAGIDLGTDVESPMQLAPVQLPLPIRLEGDVRITNAPRQTIKIYPARYRPAQSLLRAYLLLDAEGQPVTSVSNARAAVPIAETRVGVGDRYTLFLPASVNLPVKTLN